MRSRVRTPQHFNCCGVLGILFFLVGFGGRLSAFNRWVKMVQLIPWSEFESEYAENFPTVMGLRAKSFRMALGALIIQEKLGISDRPRVEQIRENPNLQYFIGQVSYCTAIAITFLIIDLSTWWRRVFCVFLCRSGKTMPVFGFNITCGNIFGLF